MLQILDMHQMTLLLLGGAICWAQDIVCKKGRLSKRINVSEADSFEFRTQAGATYAPKTSCHVTYIREASCPKMRFYCSVFHVKNKHVNCKRKDKMQLRTPRTERVYCGGIGPNVTTSAEYLKASFISDKRKQSSGAVCRVECETSDAAMFRAFQSKYNKTYSNQEEKVKRFKIWQQRINLMRGDNKLFQEGKKTYRKGENAMFDRTPTEIEANYMGLSLNLKVYSTKVSRVHIDISDFPSSINWTEKGHVTSVKNQADCGSCWAHSAAGALEGAYKKDTNRLVNIDVSYLIECITDGCKPYDPAYAFTYVMRHGIVIANETYRSTFNVFHNTQDIPEAYGIPNNESSQANQYIMNRKSQCALKNDSAVIIRGFMGINKGSEDELMQALAEIGPVSVLICAPMDLVDYAGEVFFEETCCNKPSHVNHAALVVGYGEHINKITNENESYWLVKNSWGTEWGNEGYIKMAKNRKNNCGIASYATYPVVWGDLICGKDLDTLLAAGENAELEIQCCEEGKQITCAGEECKTVCGEKEIECLRPVEKFENIEDCGAINRKIAQVKITGTYCKYRAPCPKKDGSNKYCSCCKYSYYYRRYKLGGKGCAPKCNSQYCPLKMNAAPVNHNESGSNLICKDEKDSYFSQLTESSTSLTVLCCDHGKTTPRNCTGSSCSKVCEEEITCIKMVESVEFLGHCYNDILLVRIPEESVQGVLITGGRGALTSTELFLPHTGKTCSLQSLPNDRNYHSMDVVSKKIILCGGQTSQTSCLQFLPTSSRGSWAGYATLVNGRYGHTTHVFQGDVMLYGGSASKKTSEIIGKSTQYNLQHDTNAGCSIPDQSSTIITGGYNSGSRASTVVVRYSMQKFVETLPNMGQERGLHGCGFYMDTGNTKVLVVAGGYANGNAGYLSSTEVLTPGAASWQNGAVLPRAFTHPASVNMNKYILLIGGEGFGTRRREVLKFNGTWTQVGMVQTARDLAAATKIDIVTGPGGLLNITACL